MLTTRCPHCGTAFRVKPEQLRARGGRVRCGHCQAPFSALESLIDVVPEAPAPDATGGSDSAPVSAPANALAHASSATPSEAPTPSAAASEPASAASAPVNEPVPQAVPAATPKPDTLPTQETVEIRPAPVAISSVLASHRASTWGGSAGHELAPPMPELDPSAPHRPQFDLDFDLDSDELPVSTPAVTPAPAPVTSDFVRPVRSDEKTTLTFDWRAGNDIPGGLGGPAEPHESEVDLSAPDWHQDLPESRADGAVTEVPLDADDASPEQTDDEPVFVTAFASPSGQSTTPDWQALTAPEAAEEIGEDRFSPLPEPTFTSNETHVDEITEAPNEPELIEHEADEHDAYEHGATGPKSDFVHSFDWDRSHARRSASWPWALGASVLLIATVAQALLWARHDIAREFPTTRPLFETACARIGCAMPWPRVAGLISIDASDLHPRPDRNGQLELSGTLHNKAAFAQAYPYLEVTLTDVFNRALVRRALPPETWLPPSLKATPSFAPTSDVAFTIYLDAEGQAATGYKLYAFYP
ncbi:hypothetical protein GCM10025771_17670 [Niveibacterium umoris]|uniref:Putative Zn finger-like uncharacterized protein n=1 Tax=Niveibacterium umoris TaxID=1193620 RepID=A0A840BK96_9RHOO|nr:DUF3426 domain-containing protein [Niveibacterium umoris]MBB4013043.1 putative Zn finger-like uncharacterized protein [Niveibacterium umoris]